MPSRAATPSNSRPMLLVRRTRAGRRATSRACDTAGCREADLGQPGVRLRAERFRRQPHQRQHRIAHGARPARKRERSQVGVAAKPIPVDDQRLAAPDRPVVAEARAVPDERQHRLREPMLQHARGGVGVMVLDRNQGDAARLGPAPREPARREVGMRVAGDGLGRRARQRAQIRRAPFQARHRRRRCEIADVLAGDQPAVREQRGRALLVSAEGEHPPAATSGAGIGCGT